MLSVEFDVPVQNANGAIAESFSFGPNGEVSRSLKTGTIIVTEQDGNAVHKVTFTYERTETGVDLEDVEPPAYAPSKPYRLTFEEVQA